MKNDEMNDQPDDEASGEPKHNLRNTRRLARGLSVTLLPTWIDIFRVARYAREQSYKFALEMMQDIERAGHGDSAERMLCDLVVNYQRSEDELKCRVLDMLYGDYHRMYSYQGWNTFTCKESGEVKDPNSRW